VHNWPNLALDLLQLNVDWFWLVDRDGQLVQWKSPTKPKAFRQNDGSRPTFEPDAIAIGPWKNFLRKDASLRSETARLLQNISRGEAIRCCRIACFLPHVGVAGWVRISGLPLTDEDGHIIGYQGVAQNITGQMLSERKVIRLHRHNIALQNALARSHMGVFICNLAKPGWPVEYTNHAFTSITGYDQAKATDQLNSLLGSGILAVLEHGGAFTTTETSVQERTITKPDGSMLYAELSILPVVQDTGGKLLVVLLRDVTAQKKGRQTELQQQRLEALGSLAGGMAHEINNQLQPVMMNCDIFKDAISQELGLDELMQSTHECLENISHIVKHTLQFSRRNQISVAEPLCLNTLLKKQIDYIAALLPETITTEIDVCPTDLVAPVHATEFAQIITNITNNAVHAMHGTGQLRFSLTAHGEAAQITISDTGCGMDEKTKARIFEPFFTTKKQGEGTGLGLSVCHGLVTQWGGTITVESEPGNGTSFIISIPLIKNNQSNLEGNNHEHYQHSSQ
jgi:signal transduction histidine kinase